MTRAAGPARTAVRERAWDTGAAGAAPCAPPRQRRGGPRRADSLAERAAGEREKDVLEGHRNDLDVADRRAGRARRVEGRGNEVACGGAVRGHRQSSVRPLAARDGRAATEPSDHRALIAIDADLEVDDFLGADGAFQSRGCIQRDDPAVVDDRDAVAELVG